MGGRGYVVFARDGGGCWWAVRRGSLAFLVSRRWDGGWVDTALLHLHEMVL